MPTISAQNTDFCKADDALIQIGYEIIKREMSGDISMELDELADEHAEALGEGNYAPDEDMPTVEIVRHEGRMHDTAMRLAEDLAEWILRQRCPGKLR